MWPARSASVESRLPPAVRKTRVLLADDHSLVRCGLRLILAHQPDIEVVGEANTGEEAIAAVFELRPDLVVMDVAMGKMTGVEATRRIVQECPDCRVLVLSMHKDPVYVREALRAGARGYLLKGAIDTEFLNAVRAVARGEGSLSSAISGMVLEDYRTHVRLPVDLLTTRERQILQMLAEGATAKDVAAELKISPYTVDAHRSRILKKLNLRGSSDMVRFALEHGIIPNRAISGEA
jgi:two-component system, NarL family, response regulator NreC